MFMFRLLGNPDFRAFLIEHDIDPMSPTPRRFFAATANYEEEVLGTEPFEARFTFSIEDDALTLSVDDNLDVVAATER
jgi:hypothetical protein